MVTYTSDQFYQTPFAHFLKSCVTCANFLLNTFPALFQGKLSSFEYPFLEHPSFYCLSISKKLEMKHLMLFVFAALVMTNPAFTQNWKAFIERGGIPDQEVPFCTAVQDSIIQLPQGGSEDYWTKFRLDDTFWVDNNFTLEVRLRNGSANGGIAAYDTGIYLEGCSIRAGATLMGLGWAQVFTDMYAGNSGIFDSPKLVRDLSNWNTIRYVFKNNVFSLFYNNSLVNRVSYIGELTYIQQLLVRFKGAGQVDFVKLYDRNNQLTWSEEFTDCNTLAALPNLQPAFSLQVSNDTTICKGESALLSANSAIGMTYNWTGPNGFTATQPTILFNNLSAKDTGFYQVTAQYKGCFELKDSIHLALIPVNLPITNFLGNDTTLCLGDTLLLGTAYNCATYRWQDGSKKATFLVNKAGMYTVQIEIDNQIYRDTIQVNYYPLPQIDLGRDTTLCPGETLSLNATLPTAAFYQWQNSSLTPFFTVQNAGIYIAKVIDVCGTQTSDTVEVEYYKVLKNLNLGKDTTLCPGATLLLNASDSAAISYRWQDGSTQSTFLADTAGIYTVTSTDNCNNIETDSIIIQHFKLIKPVYLGKDTTLCAGETLILNATDNAAVRYRWQDGSANATFTIRTAGLYTVIIEDACGNRFRDSIQVDYYKILKPLNIGKDTTLCPGRTLSLNVQDVAAIQYTWQDGSTNATFTVNAPGIYTVTLEDNCGNVKRDTIQVRYYEVITSITLGSDTTLCPNETITLNATHRAAKLYRWQDGSTKSTFLVTQPGIYNVEVTDSCGNTVSDAMEVKYFGTIQSVNLGRDTSLCPNTTIILNALDAAAVTYRWQDGSTAPNFEVKSDGIYAVTVSDNCNNIFSDSIQITYYQLIDSINIGSRDTTLCVGETLTLNATNKASGSYLWQDGKTTATYTVTQPGIYQIKVSDNCGNSASDEIRIRYNDVPKVTNLVTDTTICENTTYPLNATAATATFYRWQDGSTKAIYPAKEPGIYIVTVGNVCGDETYWIQIQTEYCGPCRTFVPNAFSPNNDGNNDRFEISSECNFTHYELRVFNRWGAQVFSSITPWTFWDGTANGTELTNGVYVWQLRYKADDGTERTMTGDVLLMK